MNKVILTVFIHSSVESRDHKQSFLFLKNFNT